MSIRLWLEHNGHHRITVPTGMEKKLLWVISSPFILDWHQFKN
jgi:hypothetical protein